MRLEEKHRCRNLHEIRRAHYSGSLNSDVTILIVASLYEYAAIAVLSCAIDFEVLHEG